MKVKYFFLEPGFIEDSVLYEVQLKEVDRFSQLTVDEIAEQLKKHKVVKLIVDPVNAQVIDKLRLHFTMKKVFRLFQPKQPNKIKGGEYGT